MRSGPGLESWGAGDIDARTALFADDASFADPVNGPPYKGLAAIRGFCEQTAKFPVTMRPEVERIIVCGDDALAIFTMFVDGPSGPLMCLKVYEEFSFGPDGLIQSLRPFWDLSCVNEGMPS